MMTGITNISKGQAIINGYDITKHTSKVVIAIKPIYYIYIYI